MKPIFKAEGRNKEADEFCKKLLEEFDVNDDDKKDVLDDWVDYFMTMEGDDRDIAELKASKEHLNIDLLELVCCGIIPDYYVVSSCEYCYVFKIDYETIKEMDVIEDFAKFDISGDYDVITFEGAGVNSDDNSFCDIFSELKDSF